MDDLEKDILKNTFVNSAEYKISYYALFMELAIKLLANKGITTYIVPDSYLLGMYFSKIRKYIIEKCNIISHNLFTYKIFGNATVGYSMINFYQKLNNVNIENYCGCNIYNTDLDLTNRLKNQFLIPQSYYKSQKLNRFRMFFSQEDFDIVNKIESCAMQLGKLFKGRTGIRSKIGQKNIISKEQKTVNYKKGIISSAQISNYHILYNGDWINIDPNILNAGGFDYNVINNPKILIPQTGDKIKASIDMTGLYHLNNVHSFAPLNDICDIQYITAILNSKLLNWYYQTISLERNRTMAQIDIETAETFPIKVINKAEQKIFKDIVDSITKEKQQKYETDTYSLEKQIDEMVYQLYELTDEEVRIIEK